MKVTYAIVASKGEQFREWSDSQGYLINCLQKHKNAELTTFFTTVAIYADDVEACKSGNIPPYVGNAMEVMFR